MTIGRAALGLSVIGLLLAVAPSVAGAALIKVNAPGNDPRGVTLQTSDLGGRDVLGVSYPLPGGESRTVTGWSLRKVLTVAAEEPEASAWLDSSRLPSVSLAPPSNNVGADISVSANEILDQGIFGGGRTPVFEENPDGSIDFIKPGLSGSAGVAYRYSVSVEVRVEQEQKVTKRLGLNVSPKSVEAGGRVSFRVTVPGRSPSGLSFSWTFREAESGRTFVASSYGGALSRAFARKGSYTVLVSLTGNSEFSPAVGSFTVGRKAGDRESGESVDPPPASNPASPAGPPVSSGFAPSTSGGAASGGSGFPAGGAGPPGLEAPGPKPEGRTPDRDMPDGLEQVSGELIGPDVEVVEMPPEEFSSESAGPSEIEDGPGLLGGMAGEAATLLGVGLLLALGGFMEIRFLSRRA